MAKLYVTDLCTSKRPTTRTTRQIRIATAIIIVTFNPTNIVGGILTTNWYGGWRLPSSRNSVNSPGTNAY